MNMGHRQAYPNLFISNKFLISQQELISMEVQSTIKMPRTFNNSALVYLYPASVPFPVVDLLQGEHPSASADFIRI